MLRQRLNRHADNVAPRALWWLILWAPPCGVHPEVSFRRLLLLCLFPLSIRWPVPSPGRPSRQAWQTVGSQTSTGPQTAKRTARTATRPTALPTARTDTTVGRLHILERQVGGRERVVSLYSDIDRTARWVNVIGVTVPGEDRQSPWIWRVFVMSLLWI